MRRREITGECMQCDHANLYGIHPDGCTAHKLKYCQVCGPVGKEEVTMYKSKRVQDSRSFTFVLLYFCTLGD
jgi:hypothetical protein